MPGRAAQHWPMSIRLLPIAPRWGGSAVYLVPGADDSRAALARYADSLLTAAQKAATKGVRLGVEHFPGTALASAASTLEFINAIDHPNLGLLFDIGHVQISDEDPAAVIRQAGVSGWPMSILTTTTERVICIGRCLTAC